MAQVRLTFSSGIFPKHCKISYITRIHKSGSYRLIENYRDVAFPRMIGNFFELTRDFNKSLQALVWF